LLHLVGNLFEWYDDARAVNSVVEWWIHSNWRLSANM